MAVSGSKRDLNADKMGNSIADFEKFNNFAKNVNFIAYRKMNRLKVVLAEQHRTEKWLVEAMKKK